MISHILHTAFETVYEAETPADDRQAVRGEDVPLEEMDGLSDNHERREFNESISMMLFKRKNTIRDDMEASHDNVAELVKYMNVQKKNAEELEKEKSTLLKKQSIIVGQHIPSLPTELAMKKETLDEHGGPYSEMLLVASDLLRENHEETLQRTGNLPISQDTIDIRLERGRYQESLETDTPHYMVPTKATGNRNNRTQIRYSDIFRQKKECCTLSTNDTSSLKKLGQTMKRGSELSVGDRISNEMTLKSMKRKLNYLRNPKNDPKSLKKLLNMQEARSIGKETRGYVQDTESLEGSTDIAHSQTSVNVPLFSCEPNIVSFKNYLVGQEYRQSITFRNNSSISRQLRVVMSSPISSSAFRITPFNYPASCSAGFIAPGNSITTEIIFIPNSLREFSDSFEVRTEGGSLVVPIVASRDLPKLENFPSVLDIGVCLIGDALRYKMTVKNLGGAGNFSIYTREQFLSHQFNYEYHTDEKPLRIKQFTIYPRSFHLGCDSNFDVDSEVVLNIDYIPLENLSAELDLVIVSDLRQKWETKVVATCKRVELRIMDLNFVDMKTHCSSTSSYKENMNLAFGSIAIDRECHQEFSIENLSDVPIQYQWKFVDSKSRSRSSNKICPFNIQPMSGVLRNNFEGVNRFTLSFSSSSVDIFSYKAVLILMNIPKIALKSIDNECALDDLKTNGHGKFISLHGLLHNSCERIDLLKDIDDVPIHGEASATTIETNKVGLSHIDLIALNDVVQIVINNTTGVVDQKEIDTFLLYIKNIIELYISFLEDEDDYEIKQCDHESIAVDERNGAGPHIVSIYWKADQKDQPTFLRSTSLHSLQIDDSSIVLKDYASRIGKSETEIFKELYLPLNDAVTIIGDVVCEHLNGEINGEAVEYLQKQNRGYVIGLEILVCGETISSTSRFSWAQSKPLDTSDISQSVLRIDDICVEQEWFGAFELQNKENKNIEAYIDRTGILIQMMDPVLIPHYNSIPTFEFHTDMERISLMPHIDEFVTFNFLAASIGSFKVNVPVIAFDGTSRKDLVLYSNCIHPVIRFEVPFLDIGLLGVGNKRQISLNFTNESSLRMHYILQCVPHDSSLLKSRQNEINRQLDRKRMTLDGAETFTSDASENVEQNVEFLFEPNSATIKKNQTSSVDMTCSSGQKAENFRGSLDCSFISLRIPSLLFSRHVSIGTEIQAPVVILNPNVIDLGDVYIGQSIEFSFSIINLTSLPTSFLLETCNMGVENYDVHQANGDLILIGQNFKLKLNNIECKLPPMKFVEVSGEFTGLKQCTLNKIFSCKVKGMSQRLGFSLHTVVKGIKLKFTKTDESIHDLLSPELESLDVGNKVSLYERKIVIFSIINLSAVSAPYSFTVKKYSIENFASVNSRSRINEVEFLKLKEGGEHNFCSLEGKLSMLHDEHRIQDESYLSRGLGGAYMIFPSSGTLSPWESEVITITTFNDTPGCYDDEIICTIQDKIYPAMEQKIFIPIKMTVEGCPLVIEKDTVGMTTVTKKEKLGIVQVPLLHVGNNFVGAEPFHRDFYIKNNGSSPMKISWSVRNTDKVVNGMIKFNLSIISCVDRNDENVHYSGCKDLIRTSIQFWDDIIEDVSFRVEPNNYTLEPHRHFKFQAIRESTIKQGSHDAIAICNVLDNSYQKYNPKRRRVYTKSIELFLRSTLYYPALRINDKIVYADGFGNMGDIDLKINLITPITNLYESSAKTPSKMIVLENPTMLPMLFDVNMDGPFIFDAVETSNCIIGRSTSNCHSSIQAIRLNPQQKKNMFITVNSHNLLGNTLMNLGSHEESEEVGSFTVHFSSGYILSVPIKATYLTPFLSASVSKLNFGCCHVSKSCEGSIMIQNTTNVLAEWVLVNVPHGGGAYRSTNMYVEGFDRKIFPVDDPSVFEISPRGGQIRGPTIQVSDCKSLFPTEILVKFIPKSNIRYSSRIRVKCQYGNSFEILLEGEGTLEEHEHRPLSPMSLY